MRLAMASLQTFAEVLADYVDMKSTFTLGHSRGVAELAGKAGAELGLAQAALDELRIAALVHDVGRVSVSNAIWDKPGAFDAGERERTRGLTDKEIAQRLAISHRSVHHHNQHAFGKLGVSTRSGAALFLIENDLVER
jgi:HD-GYP domain-containing protein (c-di-GMP phosphodiesterase class II)